MEGCLCGFNSGSSTIRSRERFRMASRWYLRTAGFGCAVGGARSGDSRQRGGALLTLRAYTADRTPARRMARRRTLDAEASYHVGPRGRWRGTALGLDRIYRRRPGAAAQAGRRSPREQPFRALLPAPVDRRTPAALARD